MGGGAAHTISKPGYPYDTIMTFWINYIHYDTIMTLLLHLWQLQKSDYYDTLWQKAGKAYYYTYDMSIIAIMTFWIYYDTYVYYDSIISIITFWTIITLITLRNYYCILWQLQNIMCIIFIMTLLYPLLHFELLLHLWHWGTIISYYDNCKTLCALALVS